MASSMTTRDVQVPFDQGHLAGTLFMPANITDNRKCAIVIHGMLANRVRQPCRTVIDTLVQRFGYTVLSCDLAGCGASSKLTFVPGSLERQARQIDAMIEFLEEEHLRVSVICGHSMGGATVGWFACKHLDDTSAVRLVINISGHFDYSQPLKLDEKQQAELENKGETIRTAFGHSFRLTKAMMEERASYNFRTAVQSLPAHIKFVTFHGTDDAFVPFDDGKMIHQALLTANKHSDLIELPGCSHFFDRGLEEQKFANALFDWLSKQTA